LAACGTDFGTAQVSFDLAATLPALTASSAHAPASPANGAPVVYTLTVNNTSQATLTDLRLVDTLPANVTFGTENHDDPRMASLTFNRTGNLLYWNGALTLGPLESATVQVFGTTAMCFTGLVSNTVWAKATAACGTPVQGAGIDGGFTLVPPVTSITVTQWHNPVSPVNGGAVTFTIQVVNTGTATLTSLNVADTLSANISYASNDSPAGVNWNGPTSGLVGWNGTGLTFSPGQTWTLTITGTNTSCFAGLVSNTAWITAASVCSATAYKALDDGYALTAPGPSIAVIKTAIPANPANGAPVTYNILVTNTGVVTLTNLMVTDTLAANVAFTSQSATPWLTWNGNSSGVIAWSGTVTLAPAASATVTILGTTALCYTGNVSNTAMAVGTAACGKDMKTAQVSFDLAATLPALTASSAHAPASPANGAPVVYTLTVNNTSQATLTDLRLVDTLPANVAFVSQNHDDPRVSSLTFNNTGNLLYWNGALTLGPLESATVQVFGTTALCFSGFISNTAWVRATAACGTPVQAKGVDGGFGLAAALPSLAVSSAHVPAAPASGAAVTYTITVNNTSQATFTDLRLVDTLTANVTFVSEDHSDPRMAGLTFNNTGGRLTWDGALTLGPLESATVQVFGTTSLCGGGWVSNTAWANATSACGPVQAKGIDSGYALVSSPAVLVASAQATGPVNIGQVVTVSLTVTNSGSQDAVNVVPRIRVGPGAALVSFVSGPVPAGPLTVQGLGTTTFVWSYVASASGNPVFSVTAEGTTCGASPVAGWKAVSSTIQAGANLSARINAQTSGACVGGSFNIVLSVTNTGATAANSFAVEPPLVAPAGVATIASGPVPAIPASLAGGASGIYTWTVNAASAGTADFTATVTGVDAITSGALSVMPVSPAVTVSTGGLLDAVVHVPAVVSTGYNFTVSMTVTNTGGATVNTIVPVLSAAPASVVYVNGPSPSLTNLAPGVGQTFNWTYRATAVAPVVAISATATGLTCGGTTVTGTAWGGSVAQGAAALALSISVSPTSLIDGQTGLVMVTVTNTGMAGAMTVTPSLNALGTASLMAGPNPSGPSALAGGTSITFTWTYTGTTGNGSFTAIASGIDANSAGAVNSGLVAGPSVHFYSGATLVAGPLTLTPSLAPSGALVVARMQVKNTGETGATFNFRFTENGGAYGASNPVSPSGAVAIAGLETLFVDWSYTPAGCGSVSVTASVTGTENGTGRILYAYIPGPVTGQVYGLADSVQMVANPAKGLVGSASDVTIRVLDSCGVPVANVPLALTVSAGGGSITPATINTGATGESKVVFRLGWTPAINKLRADVTGAGPQPGGTIYVEGVASDKETAYLTKNFFNPRKESLGIRFQVPSACRVQAMVFTVAGEMVRKIDDRELSAGLKQWNWDGNNDRGEAVATGTYFVHLNICGVVKNMQVILMKK
jgi:uncharacterized repeat protein (TIGR01451 family)